jgi:hypothetical protein
MISWIKWKEFVCKKLLGSGANQIKKGEKLLERMGRKH